MTDTADPFIGYSGYELSEDAYVYDEDECYIGDTKDSARQFIGAAYCSEYRIEPVTLSHMMKDFGSSLGHFSMEPEALARFRDAASKEGIVYEMRPLDGDFSLTAVSVEGVKWQDA
jgi:hypothetical protein